MKISCYSIEMYSRKMTPLVIEAANLFEVKVDSDEKIDVNQLPAAPKLIEDIYR